MKTIHRIDPRAKLPKPVEQVKHWLDLLRLEYVILADMQDETYTFLLTIKNCPDINIALENNFSHISFFSNGLTSLFDVPEDTINSFLRQILQLQGNYFTGRVISTGEEEDENLRVFIGFRFDEMSMYRFSRKIRELIQFAKEVSEIIEKHKMKEIWRDTEQEPRFPTINMKERVRFI
jgi:hypothetical protein